MPYIGNPPAEAFTSTTKDSFSGDGSTTAFTMTRPSTTNNVRVVVENVIQNPTTAYTCSGTTLNFTSAPPTGTNNIYVVHMGPSEQYIKPEEGTVGGYFRGRRGEVGEQQGRKDIFRVHEQTLDADVTIAATENAIAVGPLTVDTGVTLAVTTGGNLSIV